MKLKGSSFYGNASDMVVWDVYDAVYPPKEVDAFFITTKFWLTNNQRRKTCGAYVIIYLYLCLISYDTSDHQLTCTVCNLIQTHFLIA